MKKISYVEQNNSFLIANKKVDVPLRYEKSTNLRIDINRCDMGSFVKVDRQRMLDIKDPCCLFSMLTEKMRMMIKTITIHSRENLMTTSVCKKL